ncbi:hypothetical protein JVU11DRAFT_5016 [Chiua virens]|nr:hypothetical protein JVU11DRAFT_5016 [Chiua virens]
MSVAPSPSSSRGQVILQPAYFTSLSFVRPARADVDSLIHEYSRQYTHSDQLRSRPFSLFKEIWHSQGWTWIQFKVFDARSRATFLRVMMRLFIERISTEDSPLNRVTALFGLYTIYHTQPTISAPSLYFAAQVQVTCDQYAEILTLSDALDQKFLLPIRPHVIYVQSRLLQAQVFQVLPHAETHPLSPRALPREDVVETSAEGPRKRGRPSKREKIRNAREALVALDRLYDGDMVESAAASETRERYALASAGLLGEL